MTCSDLHRLLQGTPLAEWPESRRAAADAHAAGCSPCGLSLKVARDLASRLKRIPEPAPPAGLVAAVLVRIERQGGQRPAASSGAAPGLIVAEAWGRWPAWATAAGIVMGVAVHAHGIVTARGPSVLSDSRSLWWVDGVMPTPGPGLVALVLAVGLGLYLSVVVTRSLPEGARDSSGVR